MADFDWGNLLYLAVIIALSILGGRKKKKRKPIPYQPVTESQSDSDTGFFEKILGEDVKEFFPNIQNEAPKPVFEHIYDEPSPSPIVNDNVKEDFDRRRKIGDKSPRKPQIINEEAIHEDRSEIFDVLKDFDLRKAVIYSEILTPKKY